MAKKFCSECGHEVFEEGNCHSCRILHYTKLRCRYSIRELKSMSEVPLSYSKDTQTDDSSDMRRFIRALLLRRPYAAIDKAVKENRWKDAYELEIKYHMEAAMSITSDGPVRFAAPPTHPESKPPACTSDEYVKEPDEPRIRVILHGPKRIINEWTGKPKPDPWSGWRREPKSNAHGSNKIDIIPPLHR